MERVCYPSRAHSIACGREPTPAAFGIGGGSSVVTSDSPRDRMTIRFLREEVGQGANQVAARRQFMASCVAPPRLANSPALTNLPPTQTLQWPLRGT